MFSSKADIDMVLIVENEIQEDIKLLLSSNIEKNHVLREKKIIFYLIMFLALEFVLFE